MHPRAGGRDLLWPINHLSINRPRICHLFRSRQITHSLSMTNPPDPSQSSNFIQPVGCWGPRKRKRGRKASPFGFSLEPSSIHPYLLLRQHSFPSSSHLQACAKPGTLYAKSTFFQSVLRRRRLIKGAKRRGKSVSGGYPILEIMNSKKKKCKTLTKEVSSAAPFLLNSRTPE
jgi:hypothetical protein